MRVARVRVQAPVASFRYPFFVTGRQPSFDVPPPSTVHGHCASALGSWPAPETFFFGLYFRYRAKAADLEHQHITEAVAPRSKKEVRSTAGPLSVTTEAQVQPVLREFLFDVDMTLYLPSELGSAFRSPAFAVVLGRSQDLAEVVSVEEAALEQRERLRLEHTLLPWRVRSCIGVGSTLLLSRYITEPPDRYSSFDRYISLHEPVFFGGDPSSRRTFLRVDGVGLEDLWCDPEFLDEEGFARGIFLHRLTGGE